MSTLDLQITAPVGRQFTAHLRGYLRSVVQKLRSPLRELSVALVNDRTMSALHFQFMGIDSPTDVLTFPLETNRAGLALAGEIVVCVAEARRQAKVRGTPVKDELLLYAIHGILHLCGFDDRTDRGYRRMHRMEDQILTELGVGPVFQRSRPRAKRSRVSRRATPGRTSSRRAGAYSPTRGKS